MQQLNKTAYLLKTSLRTIDRDPFTVFVYGDPGAEQAVWSVNNVFVLAYSVT